MHQLFAVFLPQRFLHFCMTVYKVFLNMSYQTLAKYYWFYRLGLRCYGRVPKELLEKARLVELVSSFSF